MLTKLKTDRVRVSRQVSNQARNLVVAELVAQVGELILPPIRNQVWDEVAAQVFIKVRAGVSFDAY